MHRENSLSSSVAFSHDQNCVVYKLRYGEQRCTPVVGIAVLVILALGNQPAKPRATNSFDGLALVDKSGNIRRPTDYRDMAWVQVHPYSARNENANA
jgi:hypothetical protein